MVINIKYFYFRLNEWHHLYTGIIIILLGYYFKNYAIQTFGWILVSDDLGQHIMQGVLNNCNYHTPFHYAGKPLYILRKLLVNKFNWTWLDRL